MTPGDVFSGVAIVVAERRVSDLLYRLHRAQSDSAAAETAVGAAGNANDGLLTRAAMGMPVPATDIAAAAAVAAFRRKVVDRVNAQVDSALSDQAVAIRGAALAAIREAAALCVAGAVQNCQATFGRGKALLETIGTKSDILELFSIPPGRSTRWWSVGGLMCSFRGSQQHMSRVNDVRDARQARFLSNLVGQVGECPQKPRLPAASVWEARPAPLRGGVGDRRLVARP